MLAAAGDVQWGTVSQWASAAATLLAVLVALWSSQFRSWFRRPKIRLEVGRTEPHVRMTRSDGEIRHVGFYFRVAVWNRGRSSAERVRVQITRWVYREPGESEWKSHDLDPAMLHWATMAHADQGRQYPPEVIIPSGGYWFFDLVNHDLNRRETTLVLDDRTRRGFELKALNGLGDFVAEVLVSASNCAPLNGCIAWTIDGKRYVSSVELLRAGPKAPPGGLLNILERG